MEVEGGYLFIDKQTGRILAGTHAGEQAEFATTSAARHWLAMDHEIKESTAYRAGLRNHGALT